MCELCAQEVLAEAIAFAAASPDEMTDVAADRMVFLEEYLCNQERYWMVMTTVAIVLFHYPSAVQGFLDLMRQVAQIASAAAEVPPTPAHTPTKRQVH